MLCSRIYIHATTSNPPFHFLPILQAVPISGIIYLTFSSKECQCLQQLSLKFPQRKRNSQSAASDSFTGETNLCCWRGNPWWYCWVSLKYSCVSINKVFQNESIDSWRAVFSKLLNNEGFFDVFFFSFNNVILKSLLQFQKKTEPHRYATAPTVTADEQKKCHASSTQ